MQTPTEDPRDRYELKEKIGTGSFGSVFRAVEVGTGRVVAAKIIDLDQAADEMDDIQQVLLVRQDPKLLHVSDAIGQLTYFRKSMCSRRAVAPN